MTQIEAGKNYTAKKALHGSSSKGEWEMLAVQDNRGKNEIAVWVRNKPSGVKEGQKFHIETIHDVKWGFRKDKNQRWQPSCSIEASVEPIESEFDTGLAGQGVDVDWEEMKNEGDPWADIDYLPV